MPYSSGTRPTTAFRPMLGSDAALEVPHLRAGLLRSASVWAGPGTSLGQGVLEDVGRLHHVVVDADQDHVFDAHGRSPSRPRPRRGRPGVSGKSDDACRQISCSILGSCSGSGVQGEAHEANLTHRQMPYVGFMRPVQLESSARVTRIVRIYDGRTFRAAPGRPGRRFLS